MPKSADMNINAAAYETTLVTQRTVTSNEDITRDRLPKHLNPQNIPNNLLCLPLDVRVYQGDIIVTCDYVAEGRQTFFDTLNFNGRGD